MLEHYKVLFAQSYHLIEIIGVAVVLIGSLKACVYYFMSLNPRCKSGKNIKIELGRALALGLEFKMGSEILKTVLVRDMSEIWILGSIVILRALMSILLFFEITYVENYDKYEK